MKQILWILLCMEESPKIGPFLETFFFLFSVGRTLVPLNACLLSMYGQGAVTEGGLNHSNELCNFLHFALSSDYGTLPRILIYFIFKIIITLNL